MAGMVGRIARGVVAGAAGTLAMDVLWWSRYRRGGGQGSFAEWDIASGSTASFEEASAPGQVGRHAARMVGVDLPDGKAGTTTDVVHWMTGASYGTAHALLHDGRRRPWLAGLLTGVGAFANSYATLGALGVYEPIWEYDTETLARDLSAHLLFGATTGLTYAALTRSR